MSKNEIVSCEYRQGSFVIKRDSVAKHVTSIIMVIPMIDDNPWGYDEGGEG